MIHTNVNEHDAPCPSILRYISVSCYWENYRWRPSANSVTSTLAKPDLDETTIDQACSEKQKRDPNFSWMTQMGSWVDRSTKPIIEKTMAISLPTAGESWWHWNIEYARRKLEKMKQTQPTERAWRTMQGPAHRQKIHAAEKHAPKIQHVENESVTFQK